MTGDPLDDILLGQLPIRRFGVWDAPMFDDADTIDIPVPTDRRCQFCHELFEEGDNGAIMPHNLAEHRECRIRGILGGIGHFVDHAGYCHGELGTDAGLSYRESAKLVFHWFTTHELPSEAELEEARRAG